ncbi:Zn-dependent metalloprotease [Neomicrococcus aestuarii]|uniref:Neutral metalloproteinase n=1 Tax=Neomicrococcus aestuarii TaxID=556325 RepID=A0A7W8WYW1_9MICC|nr:M4 family metallopeptidase [Neomicrococcus aestuarii]MBB5512736.1 Zn-dependent metalloprotease [Neomicrococcus aestuarii]
MEIFCTVVPPYLLESVAEGTPAPTDDLREDSGNSGSGNGGSGNEDSTQGPVRSLRPSPTSAPESGASGAQGSGVEGSQVEGSDFGPGLEFISAETSEIARRTLEIDERMRQERRNPQPEPSIVQVKGTLARKISDAKNKEVLPGTLVRAEGDEPTEDVDVNRVYDTFGSIYAFLQKVLNQSSIDGHGVALQGTVHFGDHYDNAFWDGEQMVFGDGDGEVFATFTDSYTVVAHELGHGFLQYTTNFTYQGQSGALNESCADVLGTVAEQWALGQSAEESDWFIGREVFTPQIAGDALRSMSAPGTAYDDPSLGVDPQPEHMSEFVTTREDNGGVHINSGIPNRAFYLAATAIGGNVWEGAGRVWADVLLSQELPLDATFVAFAESTVKHAGRIFGEESSQQATVQKAWETVGVLQPTP